MAAKKKIDFEAGIEELEKIVLRMEEGKMPLEESVKAYEEGMKLYQALQQQLEGSEKKLKILQGEEELEDAGA